MNRETPRREDFPESMNDDLRPAMTKKRCPKCKSRSFSFVETGEWASVFEVRNGLVNRAAGFHEPACMTGLHAECGCGHHWRIPRAIQIDDAVTEFEFPAPIAQKDRADD